MTTPIQIVTVSQLNRQVKGFLEHEIGLVHVEGEVSNLSKPYSGHFYFTLKDNTAQIRCVFFKNRHTGDIASNFADGQHLVATGKLSLYEARGDYQLIVEQVTSAGLGALYQRFEELKIKLAAEGLFDAARKKPIPLFPNTIAIISSPSGAALQDILSTLGRRYPLAKILIYPSEVQGLSAPQQLIKALAQANRDKRCDVIILGRGGGSIEDLWAFNDEQLARQIAVSTIPVISGVGHETDFTIADFVADYRAETPTAAATAATPDCQELLNGLDKSCSRLELAIARIIQKHKLTLSHLKDKLSSPKQTISTYWQRLDYLERQLLSTIQHNLYIKQHKLELYSTQLSLHNPLTQISRAKVQLHQIQQVLMHQMMTKMQQLRHQLSANLSTLHAVSPLATLDRGYAIATKNKAVLYSVEAVSVGDAINIRLAKGQLECRVEAIETV